MIGETCIVHREGRKARRNVHFSGGFTVAGWGRETGETAFYFFFSFYYCVFGRFGLGEWAGGMGIYSEEVELLTRTWMPRRILRGNDDLGTEERLRWWRVLVKISVRYTDQVLFFGGWNYVGDLTTSIEFRADAPRVPGMSNTTHACARWSWPLCITWFLFLIFLCRVLIFNCYFWNFKLRREKGGEEKLKRVTWDKRWRFWCGVCEGHAVRMY